MIKIILLILLVHISLAGQDFPVPSFDFSPERYICFKTIEEIIIDGNLEEAPWLKAEWTKDFIDIEGETKPLPRYRTRVKMLWDDNYFYLGAELTEPDIWATLTSRDDIIYYDNDFEVFIDPDGDTHSYAELEINALNTIWDLFLIQPYRDIEKAAVHNWDIKGLLTAVKIYGTLNNTADTDSCWTIEIAFPWQAFREITSVNIPPEEGDQWRVNFSRVEWNTIAEDGQYRKVLNPITNQPFPENNWVWSQQGIINMHYPEMWGYVQFTTRAPGTRDVQFIEKEEEKAKWILRQIYYAEKNYFVKEGTYTSDLRKLGLVSEYIEGFSSPEIHYTPGLFEAYVQSNDKLTRITIFQNGLISVSR